MNKHTAAILAAGSLWGMMGLFVRNLTEMGFDTPGTLLVRCGTAAVGFGIVILVTDPKQFKIKPADIWCFIGLGIMSVLFFTYSYFRAINLMSLSAAAILLYTAPSMVMVMSLVLFREKFTQGKALALVMAFCGCALVSGITGGGATASSAGIAFGLCSGFGYALYSIFTRLAFDRGYSRHAVTFYACALAALGSAVIWGVGEPLRLTFASPGGALWCLSTGIVSCFLPYMLYTYGLSGMDAGRASITASIEPVVASVLGVIAFGEKMGPAEISGVLLVLGAIVVLNVKTKAAQASEKP